MAQHAKLRIDTGLEIYFCDPQSPSQRGTNENTTGCCASTSPRAPTSAGTAPMTSPPSPPH
jgi:IS30 family transposase